jgi:uncharacterized protein YukE
VGGTWFAALGFDPAPGDPESLRELARATGRTAAQLAASAAALRGLAETDGLWRGSAAEAYRRQLAELPTRLDVAADALHRLDAALHTYGCRLDEARARARALAHEAAEAQAQLPDGAAQLRLQAARQRAGHLRDEVATDRRAAERALRAAAAEAPRDPGWLDRVVDGVQGWVRDAVVRHARAIEVAAFVASVAAGVALAVGLVGPAVALAGLSFGASLVLVHYTEADASDVLWATAGLMTLGTGAVAVRATRAAHAAGWAGPVGQASGGAGSALDVRSGGSAVAGVVRDRRARSGERDREPPPLVLAPGQPLPVAR